MSFVIRIFFMGMMAFVPSRDGKEMTVLLLDARQGYAVSDGSWLEPHKPLLLARAGGCKGSCNMQDTDIACFLFPEWKTNRERARDGLSAALADGTAWLLDSSALTIQRKSIEGQNSSSPLKIYRDQRELQPSQPTALLPKTSAERKDFSWVAELGSIAPSAGVVDPDVLSPHPEKGLIVARFHLQSGEIWTYRLVSANDTVSPLEFQPLRSHGAKPTYSQALADWMVAEIRFSGETVDLVESRFDGEQGRTVTLTPKNGLVELALMNIPQSLFEQPAKNGNSHRDHEPGTHFEMYYELAQMRPPNRLRPVPHVTRSPGVPWSSVHQGQEPRSALLDSLRLNDGRGIYNQIICPLAQLSEGATE